MTEQLPISILVCSDLIKQLVTVNSAKVNSITNKLEAQFNFQTMTANWYGNEDNIMFIQLLLKTPQGFIEQKIKQIEMQKNKQLKTFDVYSDDVFIFIDKAEPQQLMCIIAITDAEQKLVAQKEKILNGLLTIKLQKILNILAKKLTLQPI